MALNIAGGHALGVHGQDLFLNVLADAGLTLFQHLRLKLTFPVPGNRNFHVSKAGPERLVAMTIPAVVCSLVLIVISAVAQVLIQLCLQTVLHEFGNGLLEQVLDVIHAANVCHLQQLSDLLSTRIFFWAAILSGHMLTSCVVLLFYTTQEVYTKLGIVSLSCPLCDSGSSCARRRS